ncbi:unnamed protein product [Trichobilharzia szidati]|nr:unnamed protein product [Trichobilharzia szidati]
MDKDSLLAAVSSLLDPTIDNKRRSECFLVAEEYKTKQFQFSDVDFLCNPSQPSVVVLFGLQCLDYYLKHQWSSVDIHIKSNLKQNIFQLSREIHNYRFSKEETRAFHLMLSQIIVFLIKCEWPQQWPSMLPEFLSLGKIGIPQTKLVLNSFLRLYEDVVQLQDVPQARRRDIVSSLNDNLVEIFKFALDVMVEQLLSLNSNQFTDCESFEVCRESLCTMSGFLESCRLNALTSWTPPEAAIKALNLSRNLPFLSLITTLVGIRSVQIDALTVISVLLCRRIQPGTEIPDSFGPTIADSFLKETIGSSSPCNNLIKILCSSLSENPEYSDERHNFLRLLGEAVVHIGCHLITHWREYSYEYTLCNCFDRGVCECPNLPSHIFQAILRLTAYPIHVISECSNKFWITIFRSDEVPLLNLTKVFANDLFTIWRRNSLKVGQPYGTDIQSEWNRRIFESDDHSSFFARYRNGLVKCLSSGASCWPETFLPLCISWIETLIQVSPTAQDYDETNKFLSPTSPLILEWEAIDSFLDACLSAVEQSFKARHLDADLNSKVKNLIHKILQCSSTTDPLMRAKHLGCMSILLQHTDSNNDSDLVVLFLNKVFESLNSCPLVDESSSSLDSFCSIDRPKQVKTMHLASATALLRFTRANPVRLMPYFDIILTEINKLWMGKSCGNLERGILIEAVVILGFRVPQPISVQFDFLRNLLAVVYGPWCSSQDLDSSASFSELLRACESGAPGLVGALGLDKPLEQLGNLQSPFVQTRIKMNQNVVSLLAICRRLAEPCNSQQLENISLPILEPVLSPVLRVLRAFNELWLPESLRLMHPTIVPALQSTDHNKFCTLNNQFRQIFKSIDEANPVFRRLRTFLNDCHENLMFIVGLLFISLGSKFYLLPTEQLRIALHDGCCAAFEHLPDLKVNNLLRLIIRPFIQYCPKQYFETAITPLIPPVVEAAIERTGIRWNELNMANERECENEEAIFTELVLDRSARLLSRTCLNLLRLIYTFNGYEISEQFNGSKNDTDNLEDGDDVDMSESLGANGQSTGGNSPGHLAKLLSNMHCVSSDPKYQAQNLPLDPLLLNSLAKSLTWPDTSICAKAAQWISTLVDLLTNAVVQNNCGYKVATTPLPATTAESILIGVLYGLHVNGRNAEDCLNSLLSAGIKTYLAVDISVAKQNLRALLSRILLSTANNDKNKESQVQKQIETFEKKMFENYEKPLTIRGRRDAFKKLVDPIIGVPLSQRFRNEVQIQNLPRLNRPKWTNSPVENSNYDKKSNTFEVSNVYSVIRDQASLKYSIMGG